MVAFAAAALASCSGEEIIRPGADYTHIDKAAGTGGDYRGFYVLNEGNMGSNKSTLDYFDYTTGNYIRNIYNERNPNQVMELGDTGNDIAVYDGRLYIVVSGSHKVEVLDAYTATRIGQVDISSPREIAFADGKAYVTSYVGGDSDRGSVVCFDTQSLKTEGSVSVGYNPEDIMLYDGKLFVANSYNFGIGKYDNTVSVLNPSTLTVDYTITTDAVNLQDIVADQFGQLWVNTLGNYYDIPAKMVRLRKQADGKYAQQGIALMGNISGMTFYNDAIYYFTTVYGEDNSAAYSFECLLPKSEPNAVGNRNVNVSNASALVTPYCMAVNASTGDFFLTDAKNYVSSGTLYCYDSSWKLKWSAGTGDIPGHIAFVPAR